MTQLIITFNILINLLTLDNAPREALESPVVVAHLMAVADAIASAPHAYRGRLIALAYEESRFGYRFALKGEPVVNESACGIYQQIPRWAEGGRVTCAQLQDPSVATHHAVAYLKYIERRFKARSASQMDKKICHYFSGNRCDDKASKKYARAHAKTRARVVRLLKEGV